MFADDVLCSHLDCCKFEKHLFLRSSFEWQLSRWFSLRINFSAQFLFCYFLFLSCCLTFCNILMTTGFPMSTVKRNECVQFRTFVVRSIQYNSVICWNEFKKNYFVFLLNVISGRSLNEVCPWIWNWLFIEFV